MRSKVVFSLLLASFLNATVFLILLCPARSMGQIRNPAKALTDKYFEDMGLYLDLVIQGTISNVEVKRIPFDGICGIKMTDGRTIATEMTIRIDKVISGEYDKSDIVAYLCEGRIGNSAVVIDNMSTPEPRVGDEVLIGLSYNIEGNNKYIVHWHEAFFEIADGQLIPYKSEYYVQSDKPMEVLEQSARKRDFSYLYKQAEIVCVGRLVDNDGTNQKATIAVDDYLKGKTSDSTLTIDYSNGYDMRLRDTGIHLLLFLGRKGTNYQLSGGMNGIYSIQDGKLTRDSLPLVTNLSKAEELMRKGDTERPH